MRLFRYITAAALLAAPMLLASAPAQALTARQTQAQGHGVYLSSTQTGRGWMRHRHWRRHWHHHGRRYR